MLPTTEHEHQSVLVAWFRKNHPDKLLFAIPNGGHRSKVAGAKLKMEGVISGVPDIFLAFATNKYAGLFIEMKKPGKGKVSPNQKIIIKQLTDAGYKAVVCYGCEAAKFEIQDYLK